jgi:hypothetical protein
MFTAAPLTVEADLVPIICRIDKENVVYIHIYIHNGGVSATSKKE